MDHTYPDVAEKDPVVSGVNIQSQVPVLASGAGASDLEGRQKLPCVWQWRNAQKSRRLLPRLLLI